jgi:hypothetical protein
MTEALFTGFDACRIRVRVKWRHNGTDHLYANDADEGKWQRREDIPDDAN